MDVDEELAPLLHALRSHGVLTVASCTDLADAVERLWPSQLSNLLTARDRATVNYGRVVADRPAYVRMVNGGKAAPFLVAAESAGALVTRSRMVAQVAFPRKQLDELTELA
ncbi:hypothetical protein [Blastococcus sp. VKM Ac-2987]|uniref:hypothetical protein n=1 Tax=Blastococcus sp. VKM Ac-2987 TaxID=3004141 RepID=UPI0022AB7B63|nr:hypothetical protein [Blastococcus sp. VKM Ac-2987]MCZ2857830.1 hypothetical protein [Blastococcus sp. VKM Ac-2987]